MKGVINIIMAFTPLADDMQGGLVKNDTTLCRVVGRFSELSGLQTIYFLCPATGSMLTLRVTILVTEVYLLLRPNCLILIVVDTCGFNPHYRGVSIVTAFAKPLGLSQFSRSFPNTSSKAPIFCVSYCISSRTKSPKALITQGTSYFRTPPGYFSKRRLFGNKTKRHDVHIFMFNCFRTSQLNNTKILLRLREDEPSGTR